MMSGRASVLTTVFTGAAILSTASFDTCSVIMDTSGTSVGAVTGIALGAVDGASVLRVHWRKYYHVFRRTCDLVITFADKRNFGIALACTGDPAIVFVVTSGFHFVSECVCSVSLTIVYASA
jgi:hypothetical protein